jgi:amino acid permease
MTGMKVYDTEISPLLERRQQRLSFTEESLASNTDTTINLIKTCMGTGCLALPFACQQGGIVFFIIGLFAVGAWNVYSVHRLVQCLSYLPKSMQPSDSTINTTRNFPAPAPESQLPPEGIALMSQVAWFAFGPLGVQVLDGIMMVLFFGVITAYYCAVLTFLGDTPFSLGRIGDGVLTLVILTALSLVPHVGALKYASALGMLVLFLTFGVIFFYGLSDCNQESVTINVWPSSIDGLSQWFGVIVFGFGIVPMTYNYRSSMQRPEDIVHVTVHAMSGTACAYVLIGWGLYALFPSLQGDVLSELPRHGFLPIATRLAMVTVVLMTAPFLIVPCAELIEGKFQHVGRVFTRLTICGISCTLAILFPHFVQALSLVGSTCVAAVSFCVPALLHRRLVRMRSEQELQHLANIDLFMFVLGIVLTVISTYVLLT